MLYDNDGYDDDDNDADEYDDNDDNDENDNDDDDGDGGGDDDDLFTRSSSARHLALAPIVTHFWWQVRRSMV